MAEESEKRFQAIMDKLFLAPPASNSTRNPASTSVPAGGLSGGRKRPHFMTTTLALVDLKYKVSMSGELQNASGGAEQSPVCRPWDREDLLKRLATFKSMTWFAKPEVVSAINCARRGWVNVDMDIISCESCGARLFFSTPSSWPQQQVEKAASVFSLKLNNGHKLLCPWVDNACDAKLAQFPPTSPADLVDNYKKHCASLSQLSELPVISSTAIDYMKSPLLLHFLNCTPTLNECEEVLPVLYYQAQKLISLCGWEPRVLPYIVDCKDVQNGVSNASNASITNVYSSRTCEIVEAKEGPGTENEQYDHTSVVLDCRLCGARVGLWAFSTTPRPPEFVRLIGHAELNDKNEAASQIENTNQRILETENGQQSSTNTCSNRNLLNLTIAGGPPPAEQNFRPTISLPVVGQNLRTRFSSAFELVDSCTSNGSVEAYQDADHHDRHLSVGNGIANQLDGRISNDAPEDQVNVENVNVVAGDICKSGEDLKKPSAGKAMEFDPIKHHRHFCPWVASSGKAAPGWKQTLSALQHQKEFVYSSETTQPSSSLIEVEDPVGSIKKLLTPPSAKRKKFTHGSS